MAEYFDRRCISLTDSHFGVDTRLEYELYENDDYKNSSFEIYDLYGAECITFDINELPKLIKELEEAYKRYKDWKEKLK